MTNFYKFGSGGYYVGTAGIVTAEAILKYIQAQTNNSGGENSYNLWKGYFSFHRKYKYKRGVKK